MKGIFSTLTSACLLLLGSVACAGPSLDDEDLRIAEEQLASFQSLPDDLATGQMFRFVVDALTKVPMGRSGQCLKDAEATNRAEPHLWQTNVVRTFESCGLSCPTKEGWAELRSVPEEQRMVAMLKQCDAIGPEPLFGGELAQQRANFPPFRYLLLRMHAERLAAGAEKEGTDRARAVLAGYQALAPRLAADLTAIQKAQDAADAK